MLVPISWSLSELETRCCFQLRIRQAMLPYWEHVWRLLERDGYSIECWSNRWQIRGLPAVYWHRRSLYKEILTSLNLSLCDEGKQKKEDGFFHFSLIKYRTNLMGSISINSQLILNFKSTLEMGEKSNNSKCLGKDIFSSIDLLAKYWLILWNSNPKPKIRILKESENKGTPPSSLCFGKWECLQKKMRKFPNPLLYDCLKVERWESAIGGSINLFIGSWPLAFRKSHCPFINLG